jgi:lipopolysaccharide transport system permease protein
MQEVTVFEAGRAQRHYWRDMWRYRELFAILAWRDVSVRYKQTVVGALWAVIRPLVSMVVFTVIFGRLANLPSDGDTPYALLVFAGMLPWFLFSGILTETSNSLVANTQLIGKVFFPRLIIPGASVVVTLVDFAISLTLLVLLMAILGVWPDSRVFFLPVFVLLAVFAALGPALMMSSLNIRYRDFRFIVPFIVQFGLYLSPVGFSSAVVPPEWRLLYSLNPMAGVIDGMRWSLFSGESALYLPGLFLSTVVITVFMWLGLRTFRRTEQTFADMI